MVVRSTMTDLIALVRRWIGDSTTPMTFTDQQIQDALDRRQIRVAAEPLESVDARNALGQRAPVDFESLFGFWEANAVVQGNSWQTLDANSTPAVVSVDYLAGRWTLSEPYLYFPYVTGTRYDPYAAAVELLEQYLALHLLDYDFLSAGRTFKRSQSVTNIEKLIALYRGRMLPTTTEMIRTDLHVDVP